MVGWDRGPKGIGQRPLLASGIPSSIGETRNVETGKDVVNEDVGNVGTGNAVKTEEIQHALGGQYRGYLSQQSPLSGPL